MRVPRKMKKKLRACCLCLTGNPEARKIKHSKTNWANIKKDFNIWLSTFNMQDRKTANQIK